MRPGEGGARARRWWPRRVLLGVVALLLAALLAPPQRPQAPSSPAGAHPFAWDRDALWSRLEAGFRAARAAGCPATAATTGDLTAALDGDLADLAASPPAPGTPLLARLEDDVFELAPLVAACPDRFAAFSARLDRLRREAKAASRRWDMTAPAARQALYRLLYGRRAALEEVMLQVPPQRAPALSPGVSEPSATPAATILGVTVHSGDILVSRGGAPTSALIARGNDFPGNFSHVALLWVDPESHRPRIVEAHIERGVVVSSLEEYLADTKLRIMVLRPRADLAAVVADPMLPHRAAGNALHVTTARHIPYDFSMDFTDHSRQFCSEVASAAYESVGVTLWMGRSTLSSPGLERWLAGFGVRHFETQEPSDLEYDPQLVVVAEWHDPETLYRDHLDNAVTDVMLEEAEAGRDIACPWHLLPVARLLTAWSRLCNLVGRIGPVPEGMNAAAALRNRSYSSRHSAIRVRLEQLATDFAARRGYRPPYWELVRLAREAATEIPD